MKKGLFLLCAVALFFVACEGQGSGGEDDPQPTGVTYKFNAAKGILTFSGKGAMANGKETKLPEWSQYKDAARKVIIEEGVTTVGNFAFQDFSVLDNVQFPKSLKRIGENAFKNCPMLKSVTLPENLKVLGDRAFSSNLELQTPVFPASLDSIGYACFYACKAFKEVDLSNTQITKVSGKCFDVCESLTTITLPTTVTSIGKSAFAYCYYLKKVKVAGHSEDVGLHYLNLTEIGDEAFYLCQVIVDVQFPATLQRIGKKAFASCYSLYSAKFRGGNALTDVGDSTFCQCTKLRVLVYNKRCQTIAPYMFHKCEALTMVDSIGSVRHIGAHAFHNCIAMTEFPWNNALETVGEGAFYNCEKLGSIHLGANVETVGEKAFAYCTDAYTLNITSYYFKRIEKMTFYQARFNTVTLPASLEYVGTEAFAYCSFLKTINCHAKTPPQIPSSDAFYHVSGSTLHVPYDSFNAYTNSNWKGYFTSITNNL